MTHHIILWKLKDELSDSQKTEIKKNIKEGLEGLAGKIPGLLSMLIKDTTPMERIQIVKDALDGEYDEFYDDYVAGKKELSEINREYSEQYAGTGIEE